MIEREEDDTMKHVGISAIGLSTTANKLDLRQLAELRDVDPQKYLRGLQCEEMAICGEDEDAATLAASAAKRALEMWGGDAADLGMLVVGTETAKDMSRPLSGWVADALELSGAIRSYEVKHACYGGTAAVRQAVEWIASGAARGKAALVIASDVALYAPADPGEPTQGAGAVAMIITEDPAIAAIEIHSYPFSKPVFDFWRPVGESFPRVEGKFSLECYKEAALSCFAQWVDVEGRDAFESLEAICFHTPFPKMVKKAFFHVAERLELGEDAAKELYDERIDPHMAWNRRTGNTYTASAWTSLAHAMATHEDGARIGLFSYGSGAGAELMFARTVEGNPLNDVWASGIEQEFDARTPITAEQYDAYRAS